MEKQAAVWMEDIWVAYDSTVVLENINLNIQEQEIVSIVGPNGGGKTTLLNTILGFKQPFRGTVRVLGEAPVKVQRSGRIGYLPDGKRQNLHFQKSM